MPEQFGDKVYDATPYRLQKAREEGHVAHSQDLASAVLLVGATLALMYLGRRLFHFLGTLAENQLGGSAWLQADAPFAVEQSLVALLQLARAALPIFLALVVLAVAAHLFQIGPLYLPKKVAPDFSRVDPLRGARRIFSMTNLVRIGFGLFKIGVVLAVTGWCIHADFDTILSLAAIPVSESAVIVGDLLLGTCLKIGIALLLLAIFDYGYQRWRHERDLRMTHQEIRDELKNLQGDPQVAARRRVIQRQLALNRLRTAVPQSDFVVTNPTELAVAVKYDSATMEAPVVVAKGAGLVAQRIRRLAIEHGIPVIERKPLAQFLYKHVEINRPIPAEQYAAVAEILRYVYDLKGNRPLAAG